MRRTLRLRQRLALLLLLASLPGIGVAIALAANALAEQSRQIESFAARIAALHAAQHTAVTEGARIMLSTLIESGALVGVERAECRPYLRDWIERYPSFTSLTVIDAAGAVVCSSIDDDMSFEAARQPWFRELRTSGQFTVGQYAVGRTGAPLVIAAQPVLAPGNGFDGAVAVGIDLRWLEFLQRRVELPAGTSVTALSADGSILVHYVAPGEHGRAPVAAPGPSAQLRQEMIALGEGAVRGLNAAGEPRIYGFHPTDSGRLVVAVGMPPYVAYARYWAALRDTLTAPITILILALAAAWWGGERLITRWVRSLTRATRRVAEGDFAVRSQVPHSRYELGELAAAFDRMAETVQDSHARLRAALEERETLLSELNHRVKNNMQLVLSLLRMPAREIVDPVARDRVQEIAKRIQSLATVHQLLYQGRNVRPVISPDYTEQICRALADLHRFEGDNVEIRMALAPVPLTADQAVPFGLILNELVSNAHKHAFPEERGGTIEVRLERDGEAAVLSVTDDGVGLPEGFDVTGSAATGLQIVEALANQLRGELTWERQPQGTAFRLRFPIQAARVAA